MKAVIKREDNQSGMSFPEREQARPRVKVFHGGTQRIEHPLVHLGRAGLDFGQGFYVTDIRQQAEDWADRMSRIRLEPAVVSEYELDMDHVVREFAYHKFEAYDEAWLRFIVDNRTGAYSGPQFDVVEGGVANDRVIDTVEAFMADLMPLETALKYLSQHQPNNQLCIRLQKVIDECLLFVDSYQVKADVE